MKRSILILMVMLCVIITQAQMSFSGRTHAVTTYNGSNGWAEITYIGGGVPPYAYRWSTGETTMLIYNLPVGAYSVIITDSGEVHRLYGGGNVFNVSNVPQSNGMNVDVEHGVIYDFTTATRETKLSAGTTIPLPDSLFNEAKLLLNGETRGKVDLRFTKSGLVKFVKNERVYFSLHGSFLY